MNMLNLVINVKEWEIFYRRNEMPMNYSLPLEPFDVWGFDVMGPFPASKTKHTHI